MKIIEKLKLIGTPDTSGWCNDAKWRSDNKEWLKKSTQIAIKILHEISTQGITKQMLAEKMGVSTEYINRVVKGQENLDLRTICKIETALGITLI